MRIICNKHEFVKIVQECYKTVTNKDLLSSPCRNCAFRNVCRDMEHLVSMIQLVPEEKEKAE